MALRKAEVEEWLVDAIMAMYEGAQAEIARQFDVKVGLHQGSVLRLLLFVIVMEIITTEL